MAERSVDQDVAEGVELAEKGPDFERRVGERADRRNRPPTPELADEDTLIERADLGEGSATFVAKGDPIPPELAALPRRPARAQERKRGG
jgi:hypothetical protein